jgi:hypothetical protein
MALRAAAAGATLIRVALMPTPPSTGWPGGIPQSMA